MKTGAAMTSKTPWSVKGVDKPAREAAKASAHRAGMTLGAWLTQLIEQTADEGDASTPAGQTSAAGSAFAAPGGNGHAGDIEERLARLESEVVDIAGQISTHHRRTHEALTHLARAMMGMAERMKSLDETIRREDLGD